MNRMTHQVGSSWVMNRKTALLEATVVVSNCSSRRVDTFTRWHAFRQPQQGLDGTTQSVGRGIEMGSGFCVFSCLRFGKPTSIIFFFFLFQGHVAAATPLPPWGCWRLASESSPTTARPPSLARSRWSPAPPTLKVRTLATAAVQTLLPPS